MIQYWWNGRTLLLLIAISIVTGTIFYSQYLSKKIATDEKQKVETWAEAQRTIMNATDSDQASLNLATKISFENKDIPIIETDEKDNINPINCMNLDSAKIADDKNYLQGKLEEFKKQNEPIVLKLSDTPYTANKYYYGESVLQKEVRYYPIIQLVIVGLFIIITVIAQRTSYISTQNQLWAGMAKETAHQLGTPVTSLKGWVEVLKDIPGNEKINSEIEKDVIRLELITDRFGKIGSKPSLEKRNLVEQISSMIDYIKKRSGGKVNFIFNTNGITEINGMISPPLFDWVIENLLKNALDAMEGKGTINIRIRDYDERTKIDITDTEKALPKQIFNMFLILVLLQKKEVGGLVLPLQKGSLNNIIKAPFM
jgi:K+-sensing histidine kinase KdpD